MLCASLPSVAQPAPATKPTTLPTTQPTFDITLQKPADSVQVKQDPHGTTFVVVSATGIGSVEIVPAGGAFTGKVVIRFTYADGRGFARMEGKTVTTESGTLTESELPAELRNGAIEIDVPGKLLAGAKRLKVSWIDMYR